MADNSIQEKALKNQRAAGRFLFIYNILYAVAAVIVGVIALTITA